MSAQVDALRAQLIEEGFTRVFVHSDQPDKVYDAHTHPTDHVQIVLEGWIEISAEDGTARRYGPGERCDVPAGASHAAVAGPEGCTYLIGER